MTAVHPLVGQLRFLRWAADCTQQDVAVAAGIRRDTLRSVETGRRNPSLLIVAAIADALGYDIVLAPKEDATPATEG